MYVSRPPVITQGSLLTVGHQSQRAFSIQKGHRKYSKIISTMQIFEEEFLKKSFHKACDYNVRGKMDDG